jgi:hypothetical protein
MGRIFSAKTIPATTATHVMLMTPRAKRTSIEPQGQPTQ